MAILFLVALSLSAKVAERCVLGRVGTTTRAHTVELSSPVGQCPPAGLHSPQIQGEPLTWLPYMPWTSTAQGGEAGGPEHSVCSGPGRQVGPAGRLGTEEKAFENKRDSYYYL